MITHFVSPEHRERFMLMAAEDDMFPYDSERASLFYLITGNDDLYRKRRFLYNHAEHCICACFSNPGVDLSSGMKALVRLGFNLYNGWSDRYTTPLSLLGSLDSRNLQLAGNAIMIRFNRSFLEALVENDTPAADSGIQIPEYVNPEVSMSMECPYNPNRPSCKIQVECMVLEETVREASEVYETMRDENQYLRNRIQLLEDVLFYYGIAHPLKD